MPLIVAVAGALGCGESAGFTFQVTAYVTPDDLDVFLPSFDPSLSRTGTESYRQPYVGRTYQIGLPPTGLPRPSITMTVANGSQTSATTTLTPFICDSMSDFQVRMAQGWSAVESADVLVDASGDIQIDGDFDFPFWNRCDLTAPGGTSGESVGAVNSSTPQLCTEPAREQTDVVLASVGSPDAPRQPTYCQAFHKRAPVEMVQFWFVSDPSTPGGADGFQILLSHCIGAGETYPLQIGAPIATDNSCGAYEEIALDVGPANSVQHIEASAGGWSLDSVDLSLDGVVQGSVDATFVDAQGVMYQVSGAIVLPNTMVP